MKIGRGMISTPTVIVLGAGASVPYGFPTGHGVIGRALQTLSNPDGAECQVLRKAAGGYSILELEGFADRLRTSQAESIDAFLATGEARNNHRLGRCVIAQVLLSLEDDSLIQSPTAGDWHSAFIPRLLGDTPPSLAKNQLRVITFNFERSFERALDMAAIRAFGEQDSAGLSSALEVNHVYGKLGNYVRSGGAAEGRAYEPSADATSIWRCASEIRIVTDGDTHPEHEQRVLRARESLQWAERIYFLGFGYHELNLTTLNIPEVLSGKNKRWIRGTRFRMTDIQLSALPEAARNRIIFEDPQIDTATFLATHAAEIFQ